MQARHRTESKNETPSYRRLRLQRYALPGFLRYHELHPVHLQYRLHEDRVILRDREVVYHGQSRQFRPHHTVVIAYRLEFAIEFVQVESRRSLFLVDAVEEYAIALRIRELDDECTACSTRGIVIEIFIYIEGTSQHLINRYLNSIYRINLLVQQAINIIFFSSAIETCLAIKTYFFSHHMQYIKHCT